MTAPLRSRKTQASHNRYREVTNVTGTSVVAAHSLWHDVLYE